MTDEQIIKALECCTTNGASCKDCPAFVKVDRSNCKKYFRGAFDLINSQKAEIEFLRQDALTPVVTKIGDEVERREKIKAEAIKEVLDRFDIEYCKVFSTSEISFMKEFKRVFLKEMVGDNDAN